MGKVAFLFSGQGAQYPGMMQDLYEQIPESRRVFQTADSTLNRSISKLCFSGTEEELNLTHNTQPCVLTAELAAFAAVTARGIVPDAVAGFSLGEYAALTAVGVLKEEDVFPLIQKRADLMQEAVPIGAGAMAAVLGVGETELKELCEAVQGYVVPANYNCPGQIVVSGEADAVNRLLEEAERREIRAMKLPVSAPFHCNLMKPAAEKLTQYLDKVSFSSTKCPIYMNVDAMPAEAEKIKEKLLAQTYSPVCWEDTLRNLYEAGVTMFVELGPGKTLFGFVKKTFKGVEGIKVLHVSDRKTLEEAISCLEE